MPSFSYHTWYHVQIKDLGVKAGVVLNPATPLESIQHVLGQVDLILLMSGKPLLHLPWYCTLLPYSAYTMLPVYGPFSTTHDVLILCFKPKITLWLSRYSLSYRCQVLSQSDCFS